MQTLNEMSLDQFSDAIALRLGARIPDAGKDATALAERSLGDIAVAWARENISGFDGTPAEAIQQRVSTGDWAFILGDGLGKTLTPILADQPRTWTRWCNVARVPALKAERISPDIQGDPETVQPAGAFNTVGVDGEVTSWTLEKRGYIIDVPWEYVLADDVGAISGGIRAFAQSAARIEEKLVYEKLETPGNLSDGVAMFDATRSNLNTTTALNATNLPTVIQSLRELTSDGGAADGDVLNLSPRVLIVPPALENTALSLLESDRLIAALLDDVARQSGLSGSAYDGLILPVVSPLLTSDSTWYLACDTRQADGIVLGMMDGFPEITHHRKFAADAWAWKFKHVCSAAACGYAIVKNTA